MTTFWPSFKASYCNSNSSCLRKRDELNEDLAACSRCRASYLAVLEVILVGELLAGQLAALSDRHEGKIELVADGWAEEEASGLETDDGFSASCGNVVAEEVDHLCQSCWIAQERKDVPVQGRLSLQIPARLPAKRCERLLEDDSGLGKVRIGRYLVLEVLDVFDMLVTGHGETKMSKNLGEINRRA